MAPLDSRYSPAHGRNPYARDPYAPIPVPMDHHAGIPYQKQAHYGTQVPRPLYRETAEEREAREHFEFGARYGKIDPTHYAPVPQPYYPYMRYDPYAIYHRPEAGAHWTDDDEKYSVDFAHQYRQPYVPGVPDLPQTGTYGGDQKQRVQW